MSVSALLELLKQSLGRVFNSVAVTGEVIDPLISQRGHFYFRLRDGDSELKCVMWASSAQRLTSMPDAGTLVTVRGKVDLYAPRGELQLVASALINTGRGRAMLELEKLKERLKAEGLFDRDRRPLPEIPKSVGIVTSLGGAVIHDIFQTVQKRYPACQLILSPASVSGHSASVEMVEALGLLRDRVELVIIARGGGSFEELLPFSSEKLVRAVYEFPVPVISAVGHGSDSTLLDLVADHTAPTPTAAAVLVTPDLGEMKLEIESLTQLLKSAILRRVDGERTDLTHFETLLQAFHPQSQIANKRQSLTVENLKLSNALKQFSSVHKAGYKTILGRLLRLNPFDKTRTQRRNLSSLFSKLERVYSDDVTRRRNEFTTLRIRLHGLGPRSTLARGFAMVTSEGKLVLSSNGRTLGEELEIAFADGSLRVEVTCLPEQLTDL